MRIIDGFHPVKSLHLVICQGGDGMWKRDQHSPFFFSEPYLTPPILYLPNRVHSFHRYVFSNFYLEIFYFFKT